MSNIATASSPLIRAGANRQQPERPRRGGLQQPGGDLDHRAGPRFRPAHPACSQPCLLRRESHRQTRERLIGADGHPRRASQRQRQAAARPDQLTQRRRIAGCLRGAELPGQQPGRRTALQRAQPQLPEAAGGPAPSIRRLVTTSGAGPGQAPTPLGRGGRRIINHYRQTPTGGHRLPQPLPACPAGRDGSCGDAEGPQPSAQHLPGRFTHPERTGQTGIELPFTELLWCSCNHHEASAVLPTPGTPETTTVTGQPSGAASSRSSALFRRPARRATQADREADRAPETRRHSRRHFRWPTSQRNYLRPAIRDCRLTTRRGERD